MQNRTSVSLLDQVKQTENHEAWNRFYDLYSPLIMTFAYRKGCSEDMALEVLQETMVKLMRILPSFKYRRDKGEFKSYLLKIVDARIKDAFRRRNRRSSILQSRQHDIRQSLVKENDLAYPGQEWDEMWETNMLMHALERVKERVNAVTFRSFELSTLDNVPVPQVAEELDLKPNAIYQHRKRVTELLKEEFEYLREESGEY